MERRRSSTTMLALTMALLAACCSAALQLEAAEAAKTDTAWPQWRGPARDGIAPAGPKLLDAWPKEGPARVWKSDGIPGLRLDGGVSSPVVADGKVLIYANTRGTGKPVKVITAALLKEWGWTEGIPEDVSAKIEKVRATIDRRRQPGILLDAQLAMLLDSLTPEQAAQYGEFARIRLTKVVSQKDNGEFREGIPDWKATANYAKLMDKEYASVTECYKDFWKFVGGSNDTWVFSQLAAEAFPFFDSVICLDATTGKQLWRKDFPGSYKMGSGLTYWAASATPAISGGRCFVQGSAGLYCLSMTDGAVVWQQKTNYSSSSPLVLNGIVYAMTPWLAAFKAETGQILWLQDKGQAWNDFPASVVPWTNGGKFSLLTVGADNAPYCIDAENGTILWETAKDRVNSCATPVIVGDVMLGAGGNMALKLTPQGVEKLWTLKEYRGYASSLTYCKEHVYAHVGGGPFCFDFKTGEMKWKGPGNYSGEANSAILADGKFIGCWGMDGNQEVVMYKATPAKYEELGRFKLNVAYATSPAIVGGKLFLRLEDGVACYDLENRAP